MIVERKEVRVGQYVALSPSLDLWMQGVKFGTVTKVGTRWIHVRALLNNHVYRVLPQFLQDTGSTERPYTTGI